MLVSHARERVEVVMPLEVPPTLVSCPTTYVVGQGTLRGRASRVSRADDSPRQDHVQLIALPKARVTVLCCWNWQCFSRPTYPSPSSTHPTASSLVVESFVFWQCLSRRMLLADEMTRRWL